MQFLEGLDLKDEENQPITPSSCCRFLDLPPELRVIIYRLLLVSDRPFGNLFEGANREPIQTAIVQTCRQILLEARAVLYGENSFDFGIQYPSRPVLTSIFSFYNPSADEVRRKPYTSNHFNEMRRLRIEIIIGNLGWIIGVLKMLRAVCELLSNLPMIEYLELWLQDSAPSHCHVLEVLTSFNNVRSLAIHDVPPVYAKYLESVITGSASLGGVPDVYKESRELYLHYLDHWVSHTFLGRLRVAMEINDANWVKKISVEIVAKVEEYKALDRQHMDELERTAEHVYIDLTDS